jgi:hypothetical protein
VNFRRGSEWKEGVCRASREIYFGGNSPSVDEISSDHLQMKLFVDIPPWPIQSDQTEFFDRILCGFTVRFWSDWNGGMSRQSHKCMFLSLRSRSPRGRTEMSTEDNESYCNNALFTLKHSENKN